MGYITVSAEVDAMDVLEEVSTKDLLAELKERAKGGRDEAAKKYMLENNILDETELNGLLDNLYMQFRGKPDTPPALRDLIWHTRGRLM